ncbi:MAG: hypothetical protein LBH19_02960 [Dysgonamonadaceae bacterium]|jgi:hypothetical protein|nr:hypothetical protein [Dysgonamonadaceae bacterium]
MGTTAQKLSRAILTKEAIRQAIISKGVAVDTTVPFSDYPAKIESISSAGNDNTPMVIYDVNGGRCNNSFLMDMPFFVASGGTHTIQSAPPRTTILFGHDGYSHRMPAFAGYVASGGGQSGVKWPGDTLTEITGKVILTAKWTMEYYASLFWLDRTTGELPDLWSIQGHGIVSLRIAHVPKRIGYTFLGWEYWDDIDSEGPVYGINEYVEADTALSFVARWQPV